MTMYQRECRAVVSVPGKDSPRVVERVVSMTVNDGAVLTLKHVTETGQEQVLVFAPGSWSGCETT